MNSVSFPSDTPRFTGSRRSRSKEAQPEFNRLDAQEARGTQNLLKQRKKAKWMGRVMAALMMLNLGNAAVNTVEMVSDQDITSEVLGSDAGDAGLALLTAGMAASSMSTSRKRRRELEDAINQKGFVIDDKGNLVR